MNMIPLYLVLVARWVLYRISGGRKIPLDPRTLRPANCTDACASFVFVADCLHGAHAHMDATLSVDCVRPDGLGFRFEWDQIAPFAFIDLDHCRNPETGELEPWAQNIVTRLDSFTEVSPSGTGLHIFCRTTRPPEGGCRLGNVEIYTRARWATVTGQHLPGTPTDLMDRTEELLALHRELFGPRELAPTPPPASSTTSPLCDQELLGLAATAANGARFRQLYFGPVPAGDHSRQDYELIAKLMFWAGRDFERVDRLFRQSALMRPKWHRTDYRVRTMRAAAARCTEQYTPSLQEVRTGTGN